MGYMGAPKEGTEIEVTLKGVVDDNGMHENGTTAVRAGSYVHYVYLSSGVADTVNVDPEHLTVKFTEPTPKHWPPRVGDIWKTEKYGEFGVRRARIDGEGSDGNFYIESLDYDSALFESGTVQSVYEQDGTFRSELDEFAKLNPTLVRRRGVSRIR